MVPFEDESRILDKKDTIDKQFELPVGYKRQNIEKESNKINDDEENETLEADNDIDVLSVHKEYSNDEIKPILAEIHNLERLDDNENEKSVDLEYYGMKSRENQFDTEVRYNQEFEIYTGEILVSNQNEMNDEINNKKPEINIDDNLIIHDDVTNENVGDTNVQKIDNSNENFKSEHKDISDSDYFTANISNDDLLQSCISNATQSFVDECEISEISDSLSKRFDMVPFVKPQSENNIINAKDKPNIVDNEFEETTECLINQMEQMKDNSEKEIEDCSEKRDHEEKNENLNLETEADFSLKKEDSKLLLNVEMVEIPSMNVENDNSLMKPVSHLTHEEPSENSKITDIESPCVGSHIPHSFKVDHTSDLLDQNPMETNILNENSISTFPINVTNEMDENFNKNKILDNNQNKDLSGANLEFSSTVNNIEEDIIPLCSEKVVSDEYRPDSIDDKDKIVTIDTNDNKEPISTDFSENILKDYEENFNRFTENIKENETEIDFEESVRENENDSLIENQKSKIIERETIKYESISPSNELINATSFTSNDEDSATVISDEITFTKIERVSKDFLINDDNENQDEQLKELKSNIESKSNDDLMNLNLLESEINDDNNEMKIVSDQFNKSLNDESEPIEKDNLSFITVETNDNRTITQPTDWENIDKTIEDKKNIVSKTSVEGEIPCEINDLNEENALFVNDIEKEKTQSHYSNDENIENENVECDNLIVIKPEINYDITEYDTIEKDFKMGEFDSFEGVKISGDENKLLIPKIDSIEMTVVQSISSNFENIDEGGNILRGQLSPDNSMKNYSNSENLNSELLNKFPFSKDVDLKNDLKLSCKDQEFGESDFTEPKIIPDSKNIRNIGSSIESKKQDLINTFPILNDSFLPCDIRKENLVENEVEEIIHPAIFSKDRLEIVLTDSNEKEICEPEIIPTLKDVKMNRNLDKEIKSLDSINDFPSMSDKFIPINLIVKSNTDNIEQADNVTILSKYSEDDVDKDKVLNTKFTTKSCDDGNNEYNMDNFEHPNKIDHDKEHMFNQTKDTENDIEPLMVDNKDQLLNVLDENIGLKDEISNLVMKAEEMIKSTIYKRLSNENNKNFLELNEEEKKHSEDDYEDLCKKLNSNDLGEITIENIENLSLGNIDKECEIEGEYFNDELEKENTIEMVFDGSQGSNNNALSDDSFMLLASNGDVDDKNKKDSLQNVKEFIEESNEISMLAKYAKLSEEFQLFEIPINIINEVTLNDVALGPVQTGQLIELKPKDKLLVKKQEYPINENLTAYLLIKPENSDKKYTESILEKHKISLIRPVDIQIDDKLVACGNGPELLIISPGQELLINNELITSSTNQYFIIEIDDPNWEFTCIWQDQMKPNVISETGYPNIIKAPYVNHDVALSNTIVVPMDLFNCNRYYVLNVQESSMVTADSVKTIMKSGDVILIQNVSSFKLNDNDIHTLSEMEGVVIICNPSLPSISNENLVINDFSKLILKDSDVMISDLLENREDKLFDLHENVIQKARETVERISNRRKSVEKLNEDNEIVKDLDGLEEWINSKNQLLNSFIPTEKDSVFNLKTKENHINKIIDEIDLKTSDLEFLEVKLEQYSDDLQDYLSDSLRSRYLILRSGVNSTKLLTHDTLAEIQKFIKKKEKENLQNENRFDEDKLNYARKTSVILAGDNSDNLPDKHQKEIFKTLSNNLIISQNLLEDLKSDAKIINIQLDRNENSLNNDLQQDRVVWQLLLSRCKTRHQQLKDQSNSRISKRLSPSFFVMHTDKKIDHLARVQEEIEELFSGDQPKSNKDAYQLMKLIESTSQILENKIINNQLSSTDDDDNENKELKTHLLNILNELTDRNSQIAEILNPEIYEFYQFILNLLKDRLKLLDQCLFSDANVQTVIEHGNKEEKLEKSIQTYLKEESKKVSLLGSDITRTKKWHCHKTEYCDKLSELLKKSYDLHSNNPSDFDLEKLRAIDSEMNFIGLNLEELGIELGQIMESNYQYEQLLNNYNQFLLTANNKLHGEFVAIKNFTAMKIHVIQFKDYFSNFRVYRESLEDLRQKVSENVANRLSVQHLEVIKRNDVLEEEAHEKLLELLSILYDWSDFERNFAELNGCLETVEKAFNDIRKNEMKSQSEEYLSILESLNSKLLSNSSKVAYTLNNGKRIIGQIISTETKTDIEEFSEKWEDISSQVSLALKDEKYAVELSHDFENRSEQLNIHIDIIHEIILQIEHQIQIEKIVDFQNIVQRQSSVFHLRQRFFSQENLKKSVLKIGDSLLKTKKCNLTKLNRQLCSLENKWDEICDKIRDLEELSMSQVFASESFVIPKDDIKSLVRSIEISLDKLKSNSSIKHLSDLEVFDEQLKFLNLKLSTIEPLVDLYCQRNPGLQSDILNEEMTKKSLEIHSLRDKNKEIIVILKEIDELSQKVVSWTSSQSTDCQNIIKGFNSKMNIKLGITKIKSFQETSNHHIESIKQMRSIIGSLSNLNMVLKLDINYMSDWIDSIESALIIENEKHSQIVTSADAMIHYWKELERLELIILEIEIDVDHFIGESKSIVFNSLDCIKFHMKNLETCNERLFGQNGAYIKHEKLIEQLTNELHTKLKVSMNTISSHSLPNKMKLLSKITPYSNHLSNVLDHWKLFNEYLQQSMLKFEQIEALVKDCFNPHHKHNFNLSQHLIKLENLIKDSQNITNKISGIAEYLMKIVDQNTIMKFRNTLSINNHRLYRIKKYRDHLKNKLHQQESDMKFFDLHCERMEKIINEVDMSYSLIMPSKFFDSSFDYTINDLLKEIIESRRDINEIKSIAHRFTMDNTRKKRFELIIAKRESLINKILQTIQDRDVENCGKMDFMTLCNYCMDLMRFLEPQLQQQHFNKFDEVIEQQLCFEFLHLLIHPKESLFLILVEKGNLNQKENCGHFQNNLCLLKLQWSNITEQINNSKRYLDKTVVTYLEFLGKIECFRLWCDNLSNKLIDFESDIWSVDDMKHFRFRLAIFTQERDAHKSIYEACFTTGENVYRIVLDSDTKCRIQENLQELHEKWCDIEYQLKLNSEKLSKRFTDWYSVDENIQNLFAWIKEISTFTSSDIPYYEGLNLNLQKSEKFLVDLKSSQSLRSELRKMINELVCFLGPDDTTILFNRVYLIDKQCQELVVQIDIRRREIQNRMSVWPQFIDDCRKLTLELIEICKNLDNKDVYKVEEMITKLETEIIPTVNDYKLKFDDLKSRGIGIQNKSGEDRSKDIAYRLQKFEDIWNDTHNLANNKLKELLEIYDSVGSFEEKSGNFKKWMLEIKESLNSPIDLKEFRIEIPIRLLEICQIEYQNIQSHAGDIKSLLLLCNLLMHNNDACPNHNAKEEISNTRKKLKKRWENINDKINSKMAKLNDIISVWKVMEMKLTETDYFINRIDGRLNYLVANIDTNPNNNFDKIQILKSDINDYESEMHSLIETFETMSAKDQLDCRGQIEDQMKKLSNKFDNILAEVSILDTQMKELSTIKEQLQSSIETIKLWIDDVDKEIALLEINQPKDIEIRKKELQEIKLQFHDQLMKLKDIETEPKSLLNNENFSEIFTKLKESESIIHNLSQTFRNNILPSSRRSSQSRAASRSSVRSSASLKSHKSHLGPDSLSINEFYAKANGLVQDLNSIIVGVDQYLVWTNKLLNSVTGEIKSVTFEDSLDNNKRFNSFVELIVASRYKVDLIKGLNNELKQMIQTNNLQNIQNYSPEAVEDIQIRWKDTYELCVERDKNDLTKINRETPKEISNSSNRKIDESLLSSSSKKIESRKSSLSHRKQSFEQDLSLKESENKQIVSLEHWIKESLAIIEKKADLTNLSIICKLGLAPIQSELESLRLFLNGYKNWNFIYNGVINSPNLSSNRSHSLLVSWKELKRMAECWIENMQKIIYKSPELLREINRIKDKIQTMKNESRTVNAITDDFIDRFDVIKNCQAYWITQIEPISNNSHHNLAMNRKWTEEINKIMKDLKACDNLVTRISQAIITSDSLNICSDDIKRSSPLPIEDDMETTAPIQTSASFSDDDLANNSSLMVPSISSFEQPYIPVVSGDLISGDSEIRLRVADKLLLRHNSSVDDAIMLNNNIDNQRLAQGDFSYSFMQSEDLISVSATWTKKLCQSLLISIPIILLIVLLLFVLFMLQPECENSWECSSPLSGISVKKHWSKSAAI